MKRLVDRKINRDINPDDQRAFELAEAAVRAKHKDTKDVVKAYADGRIFVTPMPAGRTYEWVGT
jgi:hypothetical protein